MMSAHRTSISPQPRSSISPPTGSIAAWDALVNVTEGSSGTRTRSRLRFTVKFCGVKTHFCIRKKFLDDRHHRHPTSPQTTFQNRIFPPDWHPKTCRQPPRSWTSERTEAPWIRADIPDDFQKSEAPEAQPLVRATSPRFRCEHPRDAPAQTKRKRPSFLPRTYFL